MPVSIEVWGERACFTRPEFKAERMSYDIMTPSAARGVLEAIYWHPGLRWEILRIIVCNPIRHDRIMRNEIGAVASGSAVRTMAVSDGPAPAIFADEQRQQRMTLMLRDVRYVIEAMPVLDHAKVSPTDSAVKFVKIFNRRAASGQCWHQPYLGCREFAADFRPVEAGEPVEGFEKGERDLGMMLYDMDYRNMADIHPRFFHATLQNGVLDVTRTRVVM